MLTWNQALDGREFHHNTQRNADGTCQRWRRNGSTQIWKRKQGQYRIPVKHGLYSYGQITDRLAGDFHAPEDCPYR